jgi:hypothetical protein
LEKSGKKFKFLMKKGLIAGNKTVVIRKIILKINQFG